MYYSMCYIMYYIILFLMLLFIIYYIMYICLKVFKFIKYGLISFNVFEVFFSVYEIWLKVLIGK